MIPHSKTIRPAVLARIDAANTFTQPQTVPDASANGHAVNKGQFNKALRTADLFSDFTVSGLLGAVPSPASLTMTTPGGVAYVNGTRVNKASADADLTYTYPASATTYDYLADTGAITHGTSATPPAGAIVLQAVTTDASAITGVKDLRPFPASDIGAKAFLDVSGASTGQTISNAFTTISMPTVNADPGGNYDPATFIYTVPRDGLYMIVTKIRFADAITSGLSYGQGAHTSNVDGPWFAWTVTNGIREGLINTRIMRLQAGDPVRAYAYMDNATAREVRLASMNIIFLSR